MRGHPEPVALFESESSLNYTLNCLADLHGVHNTSSQAYEAAVYPKVDHSYGIVTTSLVIAKTRLARNAIGRLDVDPFHASK